MSDQTMRMSGDGSPSNSINMMRVLHKGRYAIAVGTVVGAMLGYFVFLQTEPVYKSTAQVLIKSKTPGPIPVDNMGSRYSKTEISTHAAVLESPNFHDRAIRDYQFTDLPLAESSEDIRSQIAAGLKVKPRIDSETILDLSFSCSDNVSSAKVVNGLVGAFEDLYGEMEQDLGKTTVELIREANNDLEVKLHDRQLTLNKFRQDSPLLDHNGVALNLHQERMMGIEKRRAELELEVSSLDVEIKTLQEALDSNLDINAIRIMAGQIAGGGEQPFVDGRSNVALSTTNTLETQLLPLLLQARALQNKYGIDHPDVQGIKEQIDLLRAINPSIGSSFVQQNPANLKLDDFTRADLEAYLVARRGVRSAEYDKLLALNEKFQQQQDKGRALAGFQATDAALQSDLKRTQALHDIVLKRLEEVSLMKDYGGYNIQVLAYAEPGQKVSPVLAKSIAQGALLGALAAFGIAYVTVGRDPRFTDVGQVNSALQVPVIGTIPQFETDRVSQASEEGSAVDASVFSYHFPASAVSEGYRGIRTGIYFSTDDNKRVIQVTSPQPGDGKTTLTANLAVSMASSGKRVLIIDADMRRPRQHHLLLEEANHSEQGLAAVLMGEAELSETIQQTEIPRLSLLPCGSVPQNPGELLASNAIDEVLATVREEYDFVLVDTPPMLAVSDPCSIATRVDGVVVTLDLKSATRKSAVRSKQLLDELKASLIGVVANHVEPTDDKAYSYLYGYGKRGNSAYYSDDDNRRYESGHRKSLSMSNGSSKRDDRQHKDTQSIDREVRGVSSN